MAYKVMVDRDRCRGFACCTRIAPKVFQLDEEGKSTVVDPEGASDRTIFLAAQECPTEAIIVVDEETGKRLWPPTIAG